MGIYKFVTSLLNRYLSKLFVLWFLGATVIVTFVISLIEATEFSRRAASKVQVTFGDILYLIALRLPNHLEILLPFLVFLAALLTLYRLNKTNEIIIFRSIGISVWQLAGGLSCVTLLIGVLHLVFLNPIVATFNQQYEYEDRKIFSSKNLEVSVFANGVWLRESSATESRIVNIAKMNPDTREFLNLTFQIFSPQGKFVSRIGAQTGILEKGKWILKDIKIYTPQQPVVESPSLELPTEFDLNQILKSNMPVETISFWELPYYIDLLERSGLSSLELRLHQQVLLAKMGMMVTMILLAITFTLR
ncbi:MAG TPA: LptF/LptG family permease, partial [Candidatus Nitrosotenuis sp.]|nr:LptF/LptG family permease [Candidatus Nitrosotenuis sp.]